MAMTQKQLIAKLAAFDRRLTAVEIKLGLVKQPSLKLVKGGKK